MNVHHLELFYYVARYSGIVNACRNMPYSIQQPAVSAQIIQLERALNTSLFRRKPFALTSSGQHLFDFIRPFFGELDRMESILRGELSQELRLAGIGEVLRDHVPPLLKSLKKEFPRLRVRLFERNQALAQSSLDSGHADLAVTVLERGLSSEYQTRLIAELPLVLLTGPEHKHLKSLDSILRLPEKDRPALISLPKHELLTRLFESGLQKRQKLWPITVEASGQDLVSHYVSQGLGIGLWVHVPQARLPQSVKEIPLPNFPLLPVAAYWRGTLSHLGQRFLDQLTSRSQTIMKK
jgi:DNA-binding transcriptional LysR family regulator